MIPFSFFFLMGNEMESTRHSNIEEKSQFQSKKKSWVMWFSPLIIFQAWL